MCFSHTLRLHTRYACMLLLVVCQIKLHETPRVHLHNSTSCGCGCCAAVAQCSNPPADNTVIQGVTWNCPGSTQDSGTCSGTCSSAVVPSFPNPVARCRNGAWVVDFDLLLDSCREGKYRAQWHCLCTVPAWHGDCRLQSLCLQCSNSSQNVERLLHSA